MADSAILRADGVSAALEEAHFELATEGRLARVGLKERQETAPIVDRYRYLFTPQQMTAVGEEMATAEGERREELLRLYNALRDGYLDAHVAELQDEIVTALNGATVQVDGATYPFYTLVPTINRTDDPDRRERLLAGMVTVVAAVNPLMERRQRRLDAALGELGVPGYLEFYAAHKRVDYALFASVIARALEVTRPLYEAHVAPWVEGAVGRPLGDLSCAHAYWLRRNHAPATLFPSARLTEALRATLSGLGVALDEQHNIHIDAEDRPAKNPRACVIAARIPDEVHLIIKPTGGKDDYDAFFHEAGHAEHFATTDPALPFAFRHLSVSMAQAELFSYLMENLVNDPAWLQTYLDLTPQQAAFVAYRAALNDLLLMRRYSAKYLYEYTFFSTHGDAATGARLYADHLRRHTGFSYPTAFWQYDRDAGFYSADYLRAWFGHAQVRGALRARFGERWWADRQAGELIRGLWRQGVRPEIEEVVTDLGGIPWDTAALGGYYEERLAHGPVALPA